MVAKALILALALTASLTRPASTPEPKKPIPGRAATPSWTLRIGSPPAGAKYVIEGRVIGTDGRPRRNLRVHTHHTDAAGNYSAMPNGPFLRAGELRTSVLGQYRVETELPGMAEGNPHVHFLVEDPGVMILYNLSFTFQNEVYTENADVYDELAATIFEGLDEAKMAELNAQVDVDGQPVEQVAEGYLEEIGML